MIQTFEAVISKDGSIQLLESIQLPKESRALVTILENESSVRASETALLSEQTLAQDWLRPEEDAAWPHFTSHDR